VKGSVMDVMRRKAAAVDLLKRKVSRDMGNRREREEAQVTIVH
jgi:hypothetical protein